MKSIRLSLFLTLCAAPILLSAQSTTQESGSTTANTSQNTTAQSITPAKTTHDKKQIEPLKPFSRVALGAGVSLMGINAQAATNINQHLNLRGYGNVFNYTASNITVSDFQVDAKADFASAGIALDYYPFPHHGWRLSPGVLIMNHNQISANAVLASGKSITLNDTKYYSDASSSTTTPVSFNGNLGLNANKTAFTMTTGWGNVISRRGGHWSFPLEIGAAFTGVPTVDVKLSGWICTDAALTQCTDLSNTTASISQQVNTNLNAQIAKWKSDLNPLQVYPIISFGLAYNFRIR